MGFISSNFTYNNISSQEMGVILIRDDESGSTTQIFSPTKTLFKDKSRHSDNISYYGAEKQTLTISLKIVKTDIESEFSYEDRLNIMEWLCPDDEFHEFTSEDFQDLVFSFQFNKSSFQSFVVGAGILTIEGESNLPYAMSEVIYTEIDLSTNTTSQHIQLMNNSNIYKSYTPQTIEFSLVGSQTSFKIINRSNGDRVFEFTGLTALETVSVNSKKQIISSTGNERISKFNFGFNAIVLTERVNDIEVFGKCILRIVQQFPMQI